MLQDQAHLIHPSQVPIHAMTASFDAANDVLLVSAPRQKNIDEDAVIACLTKFCTH